MSVAVRGWAPTRDMHGNVRKELSRWFHIRLAKEEAPWAFSRGIPANTISSLELLASLVGLVLLVPTGTPGAGSMTITGFTDTSPAGEDWSPGRRGSVA